MRGHDVGETIGHRSTAVGIVLVSGASTELGVLVNDCAELSTLLVKHESGWHLAFPLSSQLASDLNKTMNRIHSDANTATYNGFIATTLCAISDQAMIYFYEKPTKLFKIRPFVKRSADLGVRTIQKGLHFVIRQLFKKTHQRELIKFSELLENQLVYG